MRFGKMKINDAFNKFVSKSDFDKDEKDMLLENLYNVTLEQYVPEVLNQILSQTSLILSH